MNAPKTILTAMIGIALSAAAAGGAMAADLNIGITGVAEAKGEVVASLYNKADGWLRKSLAQTHAPATAGTVRLTFSDLPPGEYAVSVYHDVNGNGKLDTGTFGIPTEPTGASNDAPANFGPPRYDAAKFTLGAEGKTIAIKLN